MLTKSGRRVLLGVAVVLSSSLVTWQLFGQPVPGYADNVPLTYTMLSWNAQSLAQGDEAGVETLNRGARRSDGSWVQAAYEIAEDGSASELRLIVDFENARSVLLDSSLASVTTNSLTEGAVENRRSRRPGCDGETVSTVLGYEVARRTSTAPADAPLFAHIGQMREETFLAPALGCLPLEHRLILTYHDGTERAVRVERVVDVRVGEPEQSLFNVPPHYVEMSPVERLTARRSADAVSGDAIVQHAERMYQERQ